MAIAMCYDESTELYEEMLEWEREQARQARVNKIKEARAPVIVVSAKSSKA